MKPSLWFSTCLAHKGDGLEVHVNNSIAESKQSATTAASSPPRREAWSQSCTQGPPTGPKLSGEYSEVATGKVNSFFTKAFRHENTHTPQKQMPHITSTEPIYRDGAVDIKAVCSLWGIPPFSSFKRELKFIFILYTPLLIECVHARE